MLEFQKNQVNISQVNEFMGKVKQRSLQAPVIIWPKQKDSKKEKAKRVQNTQKVG